MHIFFTGLFLFLLGMEGSKRGLKNISAERVERVLASLDESLFLSLVVGIIITAIIQSSSAVSIILISLIEARILKLKPAVVVMMGANIGTTITVHLISFPIFDFFPYLILLGLLFMICGLFLRKSIFYGGIAVCSFGVIFAGFKIMTGYFGSPEMQFFISRLLADWGNGLVKGTILGAVITAIIQSSSAVTGITVSLAYHQLITLKTAVAISLGSNIGTCVTAFLASINTNDSSKSLALGHFLFNLIGVILMLPFFNSFSELIAGSSSSLPRQIANAHTMFNLLNVLVFLPFINTFVSFLRRSSDNNK